MRGRRRSIFSAMLGPRWAWRHTGQRTTSHQGGGLLRCRRSAMPQSPSNRQIHLRGGDSCEQPWKGDEVRGWRRAPWAGGYCVAWKYCRRCERSAARPGSQQHQHQHQHAACAQRILRAYVTIGQETAVSALRLFVQGQGEWVCVSQAQTRWDAAAALAAPGNLLRAGAQGQNTPVQRAQVHAKAAGVPGGAAVAAGANAVYLTGGR